ncbi:MAG: hypothetical protein B7Z45_07295 [Azorhizobium sp. 12-66-6]|nr:MAG: hypothetical protein B7Z45_07295 [Azorhizobium sp. 12-66-6]
MVPRPERPDPTERMAISEPAGTRRTRAIDIGTFLSEGLDRMAASHARAVLALVVVALLAFIPGISTISPIDRDEARFAQATKQMLETGNYVDIRFHDQVRYKKPAGIHWLQAASVTLGEAVVGPSARSSILFYRLPSLFAAIGAVLLTYWAALNFVSRRGALLAGLMMASCVLLGVEARLAKTDAVLLFTTLCSMAALARIYVRPDGDRTRDFGWAALFWTGLGVGIMIKGPMAPLFVGLPILVLVIIERSGGFLRRLKPLPGLAWCALICLLGPAGHLSPRHVGHLLARDRAGGHGGAVCLARPQGPRGALSAGLGRPGLDRVRDHRDQAAALCAAALSRPCHPRRSGHGARRARGAGAADAGFRQSLADPRRPFIHRARGRLPLSRQRAGACGLAAAGGGGGAAGDRRAQHCRAGTAGGLPRRGAGRPGSILGRVRRAAAADARRVDFPAPRRDRARKRLPGGQCRHRPLSGAEPRVPCGDRYQVHRSPSGRRPAQEGRLRDRLHRGGYEAVVRGPRPRYRPGLPRHRDRGRLHL